MQDFSQEEGAPLRNDSNFISCSCSFMFCAVYYLFQEGIGHLMEEGKGSTPANLPWIRPCTLYTGMEVCIGKTVPKVLSTD